MNGYEAHVWHRMDNCFYTRYRLLSVIAVSILVTELAAGQASAYATRLNDDCSKVLHWPPEEEVPFWINENGCGDLAFERCEAAVEAAFETVQAIACTGVRFRYMGVTKVEQYRHYPADANDAINLITWYETWPPDPGVSDIAVASFWSLRNYQGEYIEFGVALNGSTYKWADDLSPAAHDIQGVITTQVLYILGLWHSDSDQSILDGRYAYGSGEKRTLLQDDIDGVCFLAPQAPQPDHFDTACPDDQHCENALCVPGAPPDAAGEPDGGPIQATDGGKTPALDGGKTPKLDAGEKPSMDASSTWDTNRGRDGATVALFDDAGRTAECGFNIDCRDDQVCLDGRCVAPEEDGNGGCNCTISNGRSRMPVIPLFLLLLLFLFGLIGKVRVRPQP